MRADWSPYQSNLVRTSCGTGDSSAGCCREKGSGSGALIRWRIGQSPRPAPADPYASHVVELSSPIWTLESRSFRGQTQLNGRASTGGYEWLFGIQVLFCYNNWNCCAKSCARYSGDLADGTFRCCPATDQHLKGSTEIGWRLDNRGVPNEYQRNRKSPANRRIPYK